ncbi:hypothetical protein S245_066735, partial [Arachis hypogaea]
WYVYKEKRFAEVGIELEEQANFVKAKRLEFYMCLVKRLAFIGLLSCIPDILKKAQLLSPHAMVVDSIQTLDPINTWLEQNVKLNDVDHKLKDQGRQLK